MSKHRKVLQAEDVEDEGEIFNLPGRGVNISYPLEDSTTTYDPGQSITFTWTDTGIEDTDNCRLYIRERYSSYRGWSYCETVSSSTPNTGSFTYTLPETIAADCPTDGEADRYMFRVQCECAVGTVCATDEHIFQISQNTHSVSISYPLEDSTTTYTPGQSITFTWTDIGFEDTDNCRLYIRERSSSYRGWSYCETVSSSTPNTGSFTYTLPKTIVADCSTDGNPDRYMLRVQCECAVGIVCATDEHYFQINAPSVMISYPLDD